MAASLSMRAFHPGGHRRSWRRGLAPSSGFTLIEVLIAVFVLVVGLLSLFGFLTTTTRTSYKTHTREAATSLARALLEDAHTIPFPQIAQSTIAGELQAMPGMQNVSSGPTWQIRQSGRTFTIDVTACAIDEAKDGYGVHETPSEYCLGTSEPEYKGLAGETFDPTPEDLKRITAEVRWSEGASSHTVRQVEMLTSAGSVPGLIPHGLHLVLPFATTSEQSIEITEEPDNEQLTFGVSSPEGTTAMRWMLEGVPQSPAPSFKSGTEWTFSWSIPLSKVSDGTYLVSVQAINAEGVAGPPVSVPVTLIRTEPAQVAGILGGFNWIFSEGAESEVVELEWAANKERNVIGYRVWGPQSEGEAGPRLVCPSNLETVSAALSCIDFPPKRPSPSSSNRNYTVVALYRGPANSEGKRELLEGPPAEIEVPGAPVERPNPPTGLEAVKNANGSVTLSWTAPEGVPAVSFYRIYRNTSNYTGRYAIVSPATTTSFTDTDTETAHTYWVTAVDNNLTESKFAGPVTE